MAGEIYLNLMDQYRSLYGNTELVVDRISGIILDGVHYAAVAKQYCNPKLIIDLDELKGQTVEFIENVYLHVMASLPTEALSRVLCFQSSDNDLAGLLDRWSSPSRK
jgi:hypothetical protein